MDRRRDDLRPATPGVLALLLLAACAGPRALPPPEPRTSRADSPPALPRGASEPHTGELVAVTAHAGDDQARAMLAQLVLATRDLDETTLRALYADPVHWAHFASEGAARSARARARAPRARDTLVRQVVATARAAALAPDAPLEALLDVSSIEIASVARAIPEELRPAGLDPRDLVVRFRVRPEARRALAALVDPGGAGTLVIRPGATPAIVAQ